MLEATEPPAFPLHAFHRSATAALVVALAVVTVGWSSGAVATAPPHTFVAEDAADRDQFGVAVDVSGSLIAIGAPSTDLERDDAGAVYLFDASSDAVAQLARLTASDGELADAFGASVAVDTDAVLVGAPRVVLSELNEGAAYLYDREGDAWTEVAKLRLDEVSRNDMFGGAVGLDGGVAVVGAPGADAAGTDSGTAVVYERGAGGWERVATLAPEDAAAGARFGSAIAVDADRILVGASGDTLAGEDPGSAYLFEREGEGWREAARLAPSDGGGGDAFGEAVALEGGLALVGARFADLSGSDQGSAYVFQRASGGWEEVDKLTAPDPADRDQFGRSVALAGEVALVGAPRVDEPARDAGAVWTFQRGEDGWGMTSRLTPAAQENYDEFGSALAADGPVAVVGTPQDIPAGDTDESITGTVTLFREVP